jgi:catechol 2,3-dioxygenase
MTSEAATSAGLGAGTRLGAAHLTVTDLERSVEFYERAIGLRAHRRDDGPAALGAGGDLLVLHEQPGARPPGRHAGLFHLAILLPSRLELARALRRVIDAGAPLQGASDHGVSEALYLADPDGNGLELYADRPREAWPHDAGGGLEMVTEPLDLHELLAGLDDGVSPVADERTILGHAHLHVGDLDAAIAFYRDVVGFELMQTFGNSAGFLSAGGYHHHLGVNTWAGVGVPPAPPDTVGLRHWTVVLADAAEREALRGRLEAAGVEAEERDGGVLARDPSGNAVLFRTA